MGMQLISAEAGDTGTWGPQTPALPNQGRMLRLSPGLVKVTLLPWEVGVCGVGGDRMRTMCPGWWSHLPWHP